MKTNFSQRNLNVTGSYLIIVLFLSLILFSNEKTVAQSPNWLWAKGMGGSLDDNCSSIAIDANGNVYTAGTFKGTVDFDPGPDTFYLSNGRSFISKLDASGNFVWAKSFGSTINSIVLDPFGNIYIAGSFVGTVDFDPDSSGNFILTSVANSYDIFVSKLNGVGNFLWAKAMGGTDIEQGSSIVLDVPGNIYVTGTFRGIADFDPDSTGSFILTSAGGFDIFTFKLNSTGNLVWAKSMGGTDDDYGTAITIDHSGNENVYTTGAFGGTADFNPDSTVSYNLISPGTGTYSLFISKLNNSGNFIWAKAIAGLAIGSSSIALDDSDNVYTTGSIEGGADFDPGAVVFPLIAVGSKDVFISKLDSSGNFAWAKLMGGTGGDGAYSLALDASGNIYTTGSFLDTADFDPGPSTFNLISAGYYDIFISKLTRSGDFVWAKAIGGTGFLDEGKSIALETNGNVYVAGNYESPFILFGSSTLINADNTGNTSDIFIAKLDSLSTGIENMETIAIVSVYPNPVKDLLAISYPLLKNKKISIVIFDITGKIIFETNSTGMQKIEVSTSNFSEGIYLVQIKSENIIGEKKFIVVK